MGAFSFQGLFLPRADVFIMRETTKRQVAWGGCPIPSALGCLPLWRLVQVTIPHPTPCAGAPTLHPFSGSPGLCGHYFNYSPKQSCMGSVIYHFLDGENWPALNLWCKNHLCNVVMTLAQKILGPLASLLASEKKPFVQMEWD